MKAIKDDHDFLLKDTFLKDTVKRTISIWNLMIQNKSQNMLYTWTQITCMVLLYLTGEFKWTDPKKVDMKSIQAIVRRIVFSKLIFNVLKNYGNYIIVIP